jgi:hypothetical protein
MRNNENYCREIMSRSTESGFIQVAWPLNEKEGNDYLLIIVVPLFGAQGIRV